jgi:type I restriction enzyme S subunit
VTKPKVGSSAVIKANATPRQMLLRELIQSVSPGVSVNGDDRQAAPGEAGVLRLNAVSNGRFNSNATKVIKPSELPRAKMPVKRGTILMSRSNTAELVGAVAYISEDHPNLYLPDLLWEIKVKPNVNCDPEWLAYRLTLSDLRREIFARASGTSGSMKKLSIKSLLSIPLTLPDISEQRSAVTLRNSWQRHFDNASSVLGRCEELKRGLMQQLLTGKRRLLHSGREWQSHRLGDLFAERNESSRGDLPLLSITSDRGIIRRAEIDRKDSSSDDKSNYKRITVGDVGYNTMRMWQGVSALSMLEGIISPAYTVCVPNNLIDGRYAAYLFKFPPVIHLFYRYSQGLVDDTLALKFPNFSQIRVRIPSVLEQEQIVAVLAAADARIQLLQKYLRLLVRQRKSIIDPFLAHPDGPTRCLAEASAGLSRVMEERLNRNRQPDGEGEHA